MLPFTVVTCQVQVVANGGINSTMLQYNQFVAYTCNRGYWMDGPNTSICTEYGNVTAGPVCKSKSRTTSTLLAESEIQPRE